MPGVLPRCRTLRAVIPVNRPKAALNEVNGEVRNLLKLERPRFESAGDSSLPSE